MNIKVGDIFQFSNGHIASLTGFIMLNHKPGFARLQSDSEEKIYDLGKLKRALKLGKIKIKKA